MFTIFGATHTLTQEMMVLCAALGAFLIGIVYITIDVVRRNHRRRAALNRPIDTSMFQPQEEGTPAPDEAEAAPKAEAALDETAHEAEAAPAPAGEEILAPESAPSAPPVQLVYGISGTIYDAEDEPAPAHDDVVESVPAAEAPEQEIPAPPVTEEPVAAQNIAGQPILLCDGFGAGFGAKVVLADVNFAVPDQGVTTLMGPAGSGKSTLLRALGGALAQSGLFKDWGQVWFRGAALSPENRPLLVAQRIQLVQRPVLENLTFHLRDRTETMPEAKQRRWATKWLTQAGAENLVAELDCPFKDLDALSQRIVTILREAAAEPALLMLDEPATGLSEADATVLLAMLERLASFVPLLLVLQNQKHARKISSQIVLVAGGQVQAACATADFFDAPPNDAVAQFIATGTCNVPGAETVPIRTVSDIPPAFTAAPAAAAVTASLLETEEALAPAGSVAEDGAAAPDADEPPAHEESAPEPVLAEPEAAEDAPIFEEAAPEPELPPAGEPTPISPEELEAIKDEIRNILAAELSGAVPAAGEAVPEALAPEPVPAPETTEPEHAPEPLLEPEAAEPERKTASIEADAKPYHEAPAHEPETAAAEHEILAATAEPAPEPPPEPVAAEPEMAAEAEPVLNSIENIAAPEPAAGPYHEEPAHEPAFAAPEPEFLEATAEPAFEAVPEEAFASEPAPEFLHEAAAAEPAAIEPGIITTAPEQAAAGPAPFLERAEDAADAHGEETAYEPETAAPAPDILEATAEPAPLFQTAPEERFEPAAHEPEPITVAADPGPALDEEPTPLAEPEAEAPVLHGDAAYDEAEPVAAPVRFTPSSATPLTIDIEHTSFAAPVPDEDLDEFSLLDEEPTINLSANMIQSVPLPPRAATAQMSAPAADPRRFEHTAIMRHPGQGGPGPRGFVWIETGRLAATPMPGLAAPIDQDLVMLKQAGVTMLITLNEQDFPDDLLARHGLRNLHFPIADQQAPSTDETDVLLTQMRRMLDEGEVLAVHCLAGLGRTGTILAAYMVREQGLSAQAALNQIRHFNRQFVQTDAQEDFLMEYEVQQEQIQLRNRAASSARLLK
jgi:ABC-type sulfate/molybdate transport systems ATPase subunit/protein-tyrosine phosphatase